MIVFTNWSLDTIRSKKLNVGYKQTIPWLHGFNITSTKLLATHSIFSKKIIINLESLRYIVLKYLGRVFTTPPHKPSKTHWLQDDWTGSAKMHLISGFRPTKYIIYASYYSLASFYFTQVQAFFVVKIPNVQWFNNWYLLSTREQLVGLSSVFHQNKKAL